MDNEYIPSEDYQKFQNWYQENAQLVEDLQDWLFYSYALSEKKYGEVETSIEVADVTVFLELFYISSQNDNKYDFKTTLSYMTDTLETTEPVILGALESLQAHGVLTFKQSGNDLDISINPITDHVHHDHDHHHHH